MIAARITREALYAVWCIIAATWETVVMGRKPDCREVP